MSVHLRSFGDGKLYVTNLKAFPNQVAPHSIHGLAGNVLGADNGYGMDSLKQDPEDIVVWLAN